MTGESMPRLPRRRRPALTDNDLLRLRQAIELRLGEAGDAHELRWLAELDSQRPPAGEVLLCVVDGELQAALELATGRECANPFRPTADLVALLRGRADGLRLEEGRLRSRRCPRAHLPRESETRPAAERRSSTRPSGPSPSSGSTARA
jgi:hypothetical protein